eukprot:m.298213 g.298213  ORF g.298213 m.298213 type:complete len:174 (+) comp19534_c11_seq1:220-741(+)
MSRVACFAIVGVLFVAAASGAAVKQQQQQQQNEPNQQDKQDNTDQPQRQQQQLNKQGQPQQAGARDGAEPAGLEYLNAFQRQIFALVPRFVMRTHAVREITRRHVEDSTTDPADTGTVTVFAHALELLQQPFRSGDDVSGAKPGSPAHKAAQLLGDFPPSEHLVSQQNSCGGQ